MSNIYECVAHVWHETMPRPVQSTLFKCNIVPFCLFYLGRVKQKSAFEHVQNVQIQINLCLHKVQVSSRAQLFKA